MSTTELFEANLHSLAYFRPELIALGTLVVLVFAAFLLPDRRKRLYATLITLGGLAAASVELVRLGGTFPSRELFHGMVAADPLALLFKGIFLLASILVTLMVFDSREILGRRTPEFYVFLLTIFLGMSLLGSGLHLLILYMALEMVSLPSYVIATYHRADRNAAEAGLKYLLYGAVAGGAFLYGATLLYGITGAFTVSGIADALAAEPAGVGVVAALSLMLIGIGYKCSFFPMHMWVPDVYQGAPAAVGGFLSTAPKAAGFAVLIRLTYHWVPALAEGSALVSNLPLFFFGIAAITMTIGNLSALLQNNIKRLLGYSTVAHVGYMLMGYSILGSDTEVMRAGFSAISFYLIVYTLMNLGAFLVVLALQREWLDEFNGLYQRAPLPAVAMAVFLMSLTGLPPLAGFVGKFYLFSILVRTGRFLFYLLALIGVLNSVVSFFYYARVLKRMFLTEPETDEAIPVPAVSSAVLGALAVLVVGIGLYWAPVLDVSRRFLLLTGLS